MRFSWQLLRRKPEGFDVLSHGRSPTLRASFAAIIGEGKAMERQEDVRRLWFEVRDGEQAAAEGDMLSLPTDHAMLTDQFMEKWGGGPGR
jgi:hypothetical protein